VLYRAESSSVVRVVRAPYDSRTADGRIQQSQQSPHPKQSNQPPVTSHKPPVTTHKPQATSHKLQVTSHKPQATSHKSRAASTCLPNGRHQGLTRLRHEAGVRSQAKDRLHAPPEPPLPLTLGLQLMLPLSPAPAPAPAPAALPHTAAGYCLPLPLTLPCLCPSTCPWLCSSVCSLLRCTLSSSSPAGPAQRCRRGGGEHRGPIRAL